MEALAIFRMVASEFATIPDDDTIVNSNTTYGINSYMELYKDQISKKRFGDMYNKALAYLTAHKLKMQGLGEDNGLGTIADSLRVSSFQEGESAVSFSTNQQTNLGVDAEYALTTYGLEFLTIKRTVVVPILCSGEDYV